MSRQSNAQRLPPPPELKQGIVNHDANMKAVQDYLHITHTLLNQAVQSLQNRLNTVQQVGADSPPPVSGFAVAGKQGLFNLTWNRMVNVDGYVIVQASDTGMTQLTGRYTVPDGNQCSHQIAVGNVAVTASFQVYAFQGTQYSDPSPIITATTVSFGAGEAAPSAPPIAPLPPKVAPVRSGPNLR